MTTLLRLVIDGSGLSRRKAFAAIREGRVRRGQQPLTEPSMECEPEGLLLDGVSLVAAVEQKTYLMMNKPPDYVTSASDELGRRTALDLVPEQMRATGLHTVGRLDRDTSGLLLLTNDGDLTFRLTHPRHEVEKEYWLRTVDPLDAGQIATLKRGVPLDGEVRRPRQVEILPEGTPFEVSVTLQEGRNRQVRRLVQAVGGKVTLLRRVREGQLELGALAEGATRRLTGDELKALLT